MPGVGGGADGSGAEARFGWAPRGLAIDRAGNVYVADTANRTIRRITPAGVVSTLAGLSGVSGGADGVGSEARFASPRGIAADRLGNLYVADGHRVRKITPAGVVSTLAGAPLEEPVAQWGPYVMNTQSELLEAMRDFQQGKMGFYID